MPLTEDTMALISPSPQLSVEVATVEVAYHLDLASYFHRRRS